MQVYLDYLMILLSNDLTKTSYLMQYKWGGMSTVFLTMFKKTAIIVPGGFPQLSNDDNSV